jgi:hypothetical protein
MKSFSQVIKTSIAFIPLNIYQENGVCKKNGVRTVSQIIIMFRQPLLTLLA